MMGPRCPACSAKVKLPVGRAPRPETKVKCPSCGSVGKLELFLHPPGFGEESAGVTMPVAEGKPARPEKAEDRDVTRIAGSSGRLNLPPGIRCTLSVLSGPDAGKKMQVQSPRVVVGRENGDFTLTDREVAPEHCAFEITGVTCTVKDLGSGLGTFVDGSSVTSQVLSKVGEVVIGGTTLLFTMTLEEMLPPE